MGPPSSYVHPPEMLLRKISVLLGPARSAAFRHCSSGPGLTTISTWSWATCVGGSLERGPTQTRSSAAVVLDLSVWSQCAMKTGRAGKAAARRRAQWRLAKSTKLRRTLVLTLSDSSPSSPRISRENWKLSAVPKSTSSRFGTGGNDTSIFVTPSALAACTAANIASLISFVPCTARSVSPSAPMYVYWPVNQPLYRSGMFCARLVIPASFASSTGFRLTGVSASGCSHVVSPVSLFQ
mmetsp:Transcript_19590/g.39807  ORF Transcript_19590/g.39807 Transcript_19590/m.39807 type:complete len:238 (-) Transcript_19590:347-1060(-)